MKSLRVLLVVTLMISVNGVFAQMQINKPIQLTGSGTDARIEGITDVSANDHAANKIYVDTAIANRAGGSPNITFSLSADRSYVSCAPSFNTSFTPVVLTIAQTGGDKSNVYLELSNVPANVTASLLPGGGVPDYQAELIFSANGSATPGSYVVTVTATAGTATQTQNITLRIGNKKVFVTSTTWNGSGGLAGGDAVCAARATAASLPGNFAAWLSTGSVDALTRVADSPYERVDNVMIANNKDDLTDGSIDNTLSKTESNGTYTGEVYTGTISNGTQYVNFVCNNWNGSGQGIKGSANSTSGSWTSTNNSAGCGSTSLRIYCFEI